MIPEMVMMIHQNHRGRPFEMAVYSWSWIRVAYRKNVMRYVVRCHLVVVVVEWWWWWYQ